MMPAQARRQARFGSVIGLLLALALTGCGSDDDEAASGDGEGSSQQGGAEDDWGIEFAQCMRDHDVPMPDPEPGGLVGVQGPDELGVSNEAFQAALDACQDLLPQPGGEEGVSSEDLDALREFTECMRDNGIDMADASADGQLSIPPDVDLQGAEFQAAMEECKADLGGAKFKMGTSQ